ncbi:MAG: hypothetical protein R3Y46_07575 [Opitutales bacterium]
MKNSNSTKGCAYIFLVFILLVSSNLFTACCTYKNHDNINKIIGVFEEKKPIVKLDDESELKAIESMRALAEAQYSHYMYVAKKKSYASSIDELGYVHDEKGGSIALKSVWQANADLKDRIPLGASNSEYILKIIALNDPSSEIGYIAIAIPLKDNLAMYAFYVDKAQSSIMQALSVNLLRIYDLASIKSLKGNKLSWNFAKIPLAPPFRPADNPCCFVRI